MSMPEPTLALLGDQQARSLVGGITARLRLSDSPSPRLDAELLVAHAFGRDRSWLIAHPDATLEPGAAGRLSDWVERRAAGEPIAYLRGYKEWLSLRLLADRRALIPRPETELLAGAAIAEIAARLADEGPVSAWEVATGSGAVAVALALRFRAALSLGRLQLTASDLSPEALELAAENLASHGVGSLVSLACGDLLEPASRDHRFDLLVANLPYVPSADVDSGHGSLAWEPRSALDGGPDGLGLLRRFIATLADRLAPGGVALLEIGAGQADAIRQLVADLGMPCAVTTERDLAGIERLVRVERIPA
jgi:release factor glutamine methyltransferase